MTAGDDEQITAEHRKLVSLIDKAVKRGALHANTGGRKKARAERIRRSVLVAFEGTSLRGTPLPCLNRAVQATSGRGGQRLHAAAIFSSARITCMTALISARCVNACGKLPRWRPLRGSISSA